MEQIIRSEWQLVVHLITFGSSQLSEYELYKACVPDALNGFRRIESLTLSRDYQDLLDARVAIYNHTYKNAFRLLRSILRQSEDLLIRGDSYFLYGSILHRNGHLKWAHDFLNKAESLYAQTADQHKHLRCLINTHISLNNIKSYFNGDLYFLKQRCVSLGFFDLIGSIEKSLACELISRGHFDGALVAAQSSDHYNSLAGCAEDGNVARVLMAICLYCQGQKVEAAKVRSQLQDSQGKFQSFLKIYDQLALGQKPTVAKEHPLSGTPWPVHQFRKNSIVGQVFLRLNLGPVSREELISTVWGPSAIDPSYVTRLHTVITSLRSKYHVTVEYDGEFYSLISTGDSQKLEWKVSV